jgi:hypothetical protein
MPSSSPARPAVTAAALSAMAAVAVWLMAPGTSVYWDAFGYVRQAVTGEIGGLGFGRPVFILISHAIARTWLAGGGSPWQIEPVLRVCWAAVSCAAAPLTWRLALHARLGARAALLAGLAVACSPAMAHTAGQVLTDGPAVTLLLVACVWGARAAQPGAPPAASRWLALGAGAALGLAIGVREQSVLNAAVLALLIWSAPPPARRRLATAMTAACAIVTTIPIVVALVMQPGYIAMVRGWMAGMQEDRARMTYRWRDVAIHLGWILSLGPVVALAAVRALTRWPSPVWRARTVLFAVAVPALAQLLWMGAFRGLAYSPRLLLSAFPGALAIPGAIVLDDWIRRSPARLAAVLCALMLPLIIAAPILQARSAPVESLLRAWPSMILRVPPTSVIVTGQPCPAIPLVQVLAARDPRRSTPVPDWQAVCPGWGWPADLSARIDRAIREGRPVVIDLRPGAWMGAEQQAARREADGYVTAHAAEVARGAVRVWTH